MISGNEVVLPPKAQERLRAFLAQMQQAQAGAAQYFQGVIEGMGMEGEWTLDTARMVAVRTDVPAGPPAAGTEEQKAG